MTSFAVSTVIVERAAELRAAHRMRTPDARPLATALVAGATAFITNDAGIPAVAGIQIVLDQLAASERLCMDRPCNNAPLALLTPRPPPRQRINLRALRDSGAP